MILVPVNEPPRNYTPNSYGEKCIKQAIETEYSQAALADKLFKTKTGEPTVGSIKENKQQDKNEHIQR